MAPLTVYRSKFKAFLEPGGLCGLAHGFQILVAGGLQQPADIAVEVLNSQVEELGHQHVATTGAP